MSQSNIAIGRCSFHGGTSYSRRSCDLCHLEELQQTIEHQAEPDTGHDLSDCDYCGQYFSESKRKVPEPGRRWTGLLAEFQAVGVCPKCFHDCLRRGEVVSWSHQEWREYYEQVIQTITTVESAKALMTPQLASDFPDLLTKLNEKFRELTAIAEQVEHGRKQQAAEAEAKRQIAAEAERQAALERQRIAEEARRLQAATLARQEEEAARERAAFRKEKELILQRWPDVTAVSTSASDVETLWQRVCQGSKTLRSGERLLDDLVVAFAFLSYEDVGSVARAIAEAHGDRAAMETIYGLNHHLLRELTPKLVSILRNEHSRSQLEQARKIVRIFFDDNLRIINLHGRVSPWSRSNSWIYIGILEQRFPSDRASPDSTGIAAIDPLADSSAGLIALRHIANAQIGAEALIQSRQLRNHSGETMLAVDPRPILANLNPESPAFPSIRELISRPLQLDFLVARTWHHWTKHPMKFLTRNYSRVELEHLGSLILENVPPRSAGASSVPDRASMKSNSHAAGTVTAPAPSQTSLAQAKQPDEIETLHWQIVIGVTVLALLALVIKLVL